MAVVAAYPKGLQRGVEVLSVDNDIAVSKNPNSNEISIKFAAAPSPQQAEYLESEGYVGARDIVAEFLYKRPYEPQQETAAGVEARRVGNELRKMIPGRAF